MKAIAFLALGLLLVSSAHALSKTSTEALAPITPDTPNDEPQSNTDTSSGPVEAEAVDEMTADTVMPTPNEVLTDLDLHSHKQTQTQTASTQASSKMDSTSSPSLLEKDDEMDALDSTLEDASSGLADDKDSFTEPDGIASLTHHMTNVRFRSQHEPAMVEEQDSTSHDMDATLDAMDPALDLNAELDSSLNVDDADDTGDMDETAFLEMQHMELYGADLRGPERTTPEKAAMDSAAQAALMDADDSSDNDDSDTTDEQDSDMGLDLDAEDAMDLVDANMDDATDKDFDSFLNEAINVGSAGLPNPVVTAGSSVAEESK